MRLLTIISLLAALHSTPSAAQSIIGCRWDKFWFDVEPTYRITGNVWELFNKDVWAWQKLPCTAYMGAGMQVTCSAQTSPKLYKHLASVNQRDEDESARIDLEISIDRMSGAASWTREGTITYPLNPDLNLKRDESGQGQCAPTSDPATKPKPQPRI